MTQPELSADRLKHLSDALDVLNRIADDHGLNVCAYGDIDVNVGDDTYLRLGYRGGYYLSERYQ